MNTQVDKSKFLRRSLQGNAAFSFLSGFVFIVAREPLSAFLGLTYPTLLVGVGVSLMLFAAGILRNSVREAINQTEALITVILDTGWVVGSIILLFSGILTHAGNWAVAVVADIVLGFALLQLYGLRRMRQTRDGEVEPANS